MKKLIVSTFVLALVACGDSAENNDDANHAHNNEAFSVETDACEHMAEGPEQAVVAVAADGTPETISETHTRYDITLADGAGIIAVEIAEDSEMHFFFDTTDVDLTVTDASDAEVAAEETLDAVAECDEVAEGAAYDLGVGTYTLLIESSEADVSMVPVPGGDHGHDE